MNKGAEENSDNVNPIRLFGIIFPSFPSLMLRFGKVLLGFKRKANKGGRIFKKELINQGINKNTAAELTDIYVENSNLLKYLQYFR